MEPCEKMNLVKMSLVNHGIIISNHRKSKKTNDNKPQDIKCDLPTSWWNSGTEWVKGLGF